MRKITTLTALFLLLSFGAGLIGLGLKVSAQDNDLPSPGITPDSFLYFLDTLGEEISLTLTFSAEKKIHKALQYADEKLAEVIAMAEKKKIKALERANKKYQKYLALANKKVEKIKDEGKNIEELVTLITEKILKHQEILSEVFEKVPEQAQQGIKNAIEASQKGSETAIGAVSGEKKAELEQKSEEVKKRVQEKIKEIEEKGKPGGEEEEKKKKEPSISGDFSSPEAAFNTFLAAIETKNGDLFLESINEKSLEIIEQDPNMSLSTEDSDAMFGEDPDVSIFREAGYEVTEKTDKYAIMVPQIRTAEVKGITEDLPNFYFSKEKGLWKIDIITLALDAMMRTFQPSEQEVQEFIDEWKASLEVIPGE